MVRVCVGDGDNVDVGRVDSRRPHVRDSPTRCRPESRPAQVGINAHPSVKEDSLLAGVDDE